ncbi:unnamed protein product [marine sediment metagenome]|uniref:Uncharacterized protein n=1 Tax=marine sediment metagenome TaxID=412755 RepID=X1S5R7_9ZZZZ
MLDWIKKHIPSLITGVVTVALAIFIMGCPAKVMSIDGSNHLVTRAELQLQLDQILSLARIRMLSLDKQDALRAIFFQNALVLVQGQPLNPLGLLTAIAGIYGVSQAGTQVTKKIKSKISTRKGNNGTG